MSAIYDVYTHPAGKTLEESIGEALARFRSRHHCAPAAVWLSPRLPDVATAGLVVKRGAHMSPWYVYLELPAGERSAGWEQQALPL